MRRRRALVLGPVLFGVVTLLHPLPHWGRIVESLAPRLGLWIGVHVAQLVLIPLLMLTVWTLLAGLGGRPAAVARAALVVFVAFYSAFDTVVGVGTGLLVRRVSALDGAERDAAARLAQWFWDARLAVDHPFPTGTIAMGCLLAAALLGERTRLATG